MNQKFTTLLTVLLFTFFLSGLTYSQTYLTENFDYPAGDSLGAHGWVSFSGGSTNVLSVFSPGLIFAGYPLSNIGNTTKVVNTGQDAYKNLSTSDSSGLLYISFMVNVTAVQTPGDYFFALLPATSTTLYTARFYAKDSSGLRFGLSKSTAAAGGIFYTSDTYTTGTTMLVVIKCVFNSGTNDDQYYAYIFPTTVPLTEPSTANLGPITGTANDNSIGRVALRQGTAANAPTAFVDGIKVAKTWNDIISSVQNTSNNISENFTLSQNYPNPFNPSTTINFNIPGNGFVNLTVFDALGKEVGRLVNENLNTGSYNVNFNGSNLNSGIYFYTMNFTNNSSQTFTETKKLILIK